MSELETSNGIVAGITGLVAGIISWVGMRDKCDKSTCEATHKGVDLALFEIKTSQADIVDKLDDLKTLVLSGAKERRHYPRR
jgi:hypothetical protein